VRVALSSYTTAFLSGYFAAFMRAISPINNMSVPQ
jgi:hypothetical protein